MKRLLHLFLLFGLIGVSVVAAQDTASVPDDFVIGDPLPNAPELAPRGEYGVGVRTLSVTNTDQVDVLSATEADPSPMYDRELTLEVWYPAVIADGEEQRITYTDFLGRADNPGSLRAFDFEGRALRDAETDVSAAPYPLVVISHGFPGSRLFLSYLAENIASKGYVVVAVDHAESTYEDTAGFGSTLANRVLDQWFVLDQMTEMSSGDDFLGGLVEAENAAIVGYSMGGYGALAAMGAGYNEIVLAVTGAAGSGVLNDNPTFREMADAHAEQIRGAVLFAPWGGRLAAFGMPEQGLWSEESLANITDPTLWVVGSEDDVAYFEGVQRLYDGAVNSERWMLIYDNALHNVAPNPPPAEATELGDYERFADPVWDEHRINNINQHFVTAFLDQTLKGIDSSAYLNPAVEVANEAVYAVDDDGNPTDENTYWAGFPQPLGARPGTALHRTLTHRP